MTFFSEFLIYIYGKPPGRSVSRLIPTLGKMFEFTYIHHCFIGCMCFNKCENVMLVNYA